MKSNTQVSPAPMASLQRKGAFLVCRAYVTDATSHLVNIANLPELARVAHLGYRQVCAPCYDDLVAEASEVEERDEDRRAERRVKVSIKARVESNTSHLDSFVDEGVE